VVIGRTGVLLDPAAAHTVAVTNTWVPQPPPKRGFWSRLTPIQRVGLIAAALLVPCCGGIGVAAAFSDSPKTAVVEKPAAQQQLAGTAAASSPPETEPGTSETAGATEAAATETTTAAATAVVTKKTVTVRKSIAYTTKRVNDATLAKGTTKVRTAGVAGVRTLTYTVTLTDGKETGRALVSDVVTKKPVTKVVAVGTKEASSGGGNCDPNYTPCVPIASDVDCAGGSGNGPAYVQGPVHVIGSDIYDLDRDGDGIGCDS
jgi:hypothetical protein